MQFPNLFKPIKINSMVSRNRIVATPIGDFFEEKALGGAGIVVCGHTIVDPGRSSFASPDEPYVFHKYSVEEAQQRIRKCHQAGARASLELFHAGQYARVKEYAIGPMGFVREDGTEVRAMTPDMMQQAAACFGKAAKDARDLGFDMVFLHFGHGWLPAQFLSPLFNKRTDEYGGPFENRAKFPLLILQKVREALGPKFPVDMRISAVEWVEGSIEFSDTLRFIKLAEPLIDTVQISAGLDINHEGNVHMVTTNFKGHMVNADYARKVKRNVHIPVSVVGAVMNPAEAEQLIADGTVDMVAFGRSFIADPNWPNKAKEERADDIVPCIRCMYCYHISTERKNVGCSVNPRYRNEDFVSAKVEKAEHVKRVVVVGGGPGGMSAAIAARQRGHEVILFEKFDRLGGVLRYVEKEHYKEDIRLYLRYLVGQLQKSGADIRMNTAATPELVRELKPDALFVAVGSLPVTPPIEGIHNKNVMGFYEAIENEDAVGQDVVIIGGGAIGAELGLELAELKGRNVTIVELTNKIAAQGNLLYQIALRQKMDATPALACLMETACKEITPEGVRVAAKDGAERFIKAHTVIVATGVAPNRALAESFLGITPDTFLIGDCDKPRKIMEAVFEGHTIASHL